MAGSFYHIWAARQVWVDRFPGQPAQGPDWSAFVAGTLAPDLGFFPGGPARFSQRLHHESSGDFIRALQAQAQGSSERAFAAGWALHIYLDVALHPWVNNWVDHRPNVAVGTTKAVRDMWHMRLEWGIDCHLLQQQEGAFLWTVEPYFPPRQGEHDLLAKVGQDFFATDAAPPLLDRGAASTRRWVRLLPRIFTALGHTRPHRCNWPLRSWTAAARPLLGPFFGRLLEGGRGSPSSASVAWPWRPDQVQLREGLQLGQQALKAYRAGWQEAFAGLANLDLDTGLETGRQ
ncbi:MAG: hypothetical protein GKR89_24560 [Candidatus Latescibacteria bacterium]|nr:hypothetical protein [Candidatus Latescibacterota bacterium]